MFSAFFVCVLVGFPLDLKMINRHFKMLTYGGKEGEANSLFAPQTIRDCVSSHQNNVESSAVKRKVTRKTHAADATGTLFQ